MKKKPKNNFFNNFLLPKNKINKKFKNNQERFLLFNKLFVKPKKIMFVFLSIISILLAMIPIIAWGAGVIFHSNVLGWSLYGCGLFIAIAFEQGANFHYYKYALIANKANVSTVINHVRLNKILRVIGILSFILLVLAIAIMIVSPDGTFASIWK